MFVTGCSSQIRPGPRSWNGPIPLNSPIIPASVGPWVSSANVCGGQPWLRKSPHSSLPALCLHRTRLGDKLQLAAFNHSLFIIALGPIYPWTLSPVSLHQLATPPSLLWWIGFPKLHISFPFPSYPQPGKRPSLWWRTSSGSMDFRSTWSPIGILCSRPGSRRHSAPSLHHRPACPPGFIPSLTANQSGPIRLVSAKTTTWSQ